MLINSGNYFFYFDVEVKSVLFMKDHDETGNSDFHFIKTFALEIASDSYQIVVQLHQSNLPSHLGGLFFSQRKPIILRKSGMARVFARIYYSV